jgi:hypothetical protein
MGHRSHLSRWLAALDMESLMKTPRTVLNAAFSFLFDLRLVHTHQQSDLSRRRRTDGTQQITEGPRALQAATNTEWRASI